MVEGVQAVFERYEVKYILTKHQHDELLKGLEGIMQVDQYGLTTICNIYFDTPDHRIVRESIAKPCYKEKLRLRCYGVPNSSANSFVELKKKFEDVVYKRRISMTYEQAYDYLVNGKRPPAETQISHEIDHVLQFYQGIAPAMVLCYDRVALVGVEDSELRMTLDTNLRYRETDLHLEDGAHGTCILDDNYYIMEVKIPCSMPLWMSHLFDSLSIFPASYSKYGTAYTTVLLDKGVN